jgi:D-sedoheptulose 7-phosphate isomerase
MENHQSLARNIQVTTARTTMSASANDFGFEGIFERQVQALGRPGDVLIGISTSGAKGGKMAVACNICLRAPSDVTQFIQESHIMMGHILCDLAEQSLYFD